MIKVLVFGCKKIAIDVIDILKSNKEIDLVGVITDDEERDRLYSDILVSEYCFFNKIPSYSFKDKIDANIISKINPDLIFSIYYKKLFPKNIISIPKMGCINIHPSLLPKDRGPNPNYWNIRRGDKTTGVTLHYIDAGMDTGDIIDQAHIEINNMSGFGLSNALMKVGVDLFNKNLEDIINGTNKRVKQDNSGATCNTKFENNMRYIDWNNSAETILNHIKAHTYPYAGSITRYKGSEVIVWDAHAMVENRNGTGPGSFEYRICNFGLYDIEFDDYRIVVQTNTKPIVVMDYDITMEIPKNGRFI